VFVSQILLAFYSGLGRSGKDDAALMLLTLFLQIGKVIWIGKVAPYNTKVTQITENVSCRLELLTLFCSALLLSNPDLDVSVPVLLFALLAIIVQIFEQWLSYMHTLVELVKKVIDKVNSYLKRESEASSYKDIHAADDGDLEPSSSNQVQEGIHQHRSITKKDIVDEKYNVNSDAAKMESRETNG